MRKFTLIFLLLLHITLSIYSAPSRRIPRQFAQPDGSIITVIQYGDEHFHYFTTTDGLILKRAETNHFYYAGFNEKDSMVCTTLLAHDIENRSLDEIEYIKTFNLQETQNKLSSYKAQKRANSKITTAEKPLKSKGELDIKIPVILVQFQDVEFWEDEPLKNFDRRLNEIDYKEDNYYGSVKDYFIAQSNGEFTPQLDVIGPITLENNLSYYGRDFGGEGNDRRPGQMVQEACEKAKELELIPDFSIYDNDLDGEVDMVYIIYAGYGQNTSYESDDIWPHQWNLQEALGKKLTIDEIDINVYACSNELYGTKYSSKRIEGLGTLCHEFSHCLGLPDFYDTRINPKTLNFGMDVWSLMDFGCYNNEGYTPCNYSAYEREFVGWCTIDTLDAPATIALEALSTANKAYRILNEADPTGNEYFILENRQLVGWDEGLYGNGLMITHVDYLESAWQNNTVNNVSDHQRMTIVPADNVTKFNDIAGYQADLYPGPTKNTSFTNTSTPAALFYTGNYANKPVTNIQEENGIITFDFMGGDAESVPSANFVSFQTYNNGNELFIISEETRPVYIYTIEGKLMYHFITREKETRLTLSKGIYIVKSESEIVKTIIPN